VRYADITCYHLNRCLDLDEDILEGAVARILDGRYRGPLKPIPGADAVLKRIGETTGRILMVTARPDPVLITQWMKQLLDGQHQKARIVATGGFEAKTDVLLENGIHWFVEDRLDTCHLLKDAGIEPIVFRQPWNQEPHGYLQVGSWQELEQRIDFP
jgi:uncharacterized protein